MSLNFQQTVVLSLISISFEELLIAFGLQSLLLSFSRPEGGIAGGFSIGEVSFIAQACSQSADTNTIKLKLHEHNV